MTAKEEIVALKTQVAELNIKVIGIETVSKILNDALLSQNVALIQVRDRLERDERWVIDISAIMRHLLDHSMAKTTVAEEPVLSPPKKDTQRNIEIA